VQRCKGGGWLGIILVFEFIKGANDKGLLWVCVARVEMRKDVNNRNDIMYIIIF
jgi:hypothetical protein